MRSWDTILEYARWYPSPHNTQPIRVKLIDKNKVALFYDKADGLPAESYGIPFGFVTAGIFIELCQIVAHDLGYTLEATLDLADMDFSKSGLHPLGTLNLARSDTSIADFPPELIRKRRTSRLPYLNKPLPKGLMRTLSEEAARAGHAWNTTTDQPTVDAVIAVNQRTLFYDLENNAVRAEIRQWLRYNRAQAESTGDGLAAENLHMPGPLLYLFFWLHWLWKLPVFGSIAQSVYLRSMQGVRQINWLTGPFASNEDFVRAGRLLIRIWLHCTQAGVAIHPFGSVITNPRAHKEFCAIVGESESNGMAWMLLRMGYSPVPPKSHRRPLKRMLLS